MPWAHADGAFEFRDRLGPLNHARFDSLTDPQFAAAMRQPDSERLDFVRIQSPLGEFSLVSREIDQYGRIRGVNFLSFDDPDSKWRMSLKLHHGAMFRLTRRWGGNPSAVADKSSYLPDQR